MKKSNLIIKETDLCSSDAQKMMNELSLKLLMITGDDGKSHFDDDILTFVVCYLDGEPVGCGCLRDCGVDCMQGYDGKSAEIKRVYSKIRGMKIGSTIVKYLEDFARKADYKKICLSTRRVNKGAVAFYRHLGYIECEAYGDYKGKDRSICFEKEL